MLSKRIIIAICIVGNYGAGFCLPKRAREDEQNESTHTRKLYKPVPRNDPFKNIPMEYIEQFERDHLKMVRNANNDYTKWDYMDGKNADDFCAKYYATIYPNRAVSIRISATIFPDLKTLTYITPGLGTGKIIVLQCHCPRIFYGKRLNYHITKSSEPNHVYALDPVIINSFSTFHIVGKVEVSENQNKVINRYESKKNPFKFVPKEAILHYEIEHHKMVQDVHRNSLKWINGKDLKDYCNICFENMYSRKLQLKKTVGKIHSEPKILIYVETDLGSTQVVILECKFFSNDIIHKVHYMTESPKVNHVSVLDLIRRYDKENFHIIGEVSMYIRQKKIQEISAANATLRLQLKF